MQLPLDLSALTSVLTVSQLNQRVRDALDAQLDECWVVGEISNFRVPPSGHFYFSLKDARSQIAAVMFRSASQLLAFRPEDGMQVIVRGRVGVYEVRGNLQRLHFETAPRARKASVQKRGEPVGRGVCHVWGRRVAGATRAAGRGDPAGRPCFHQTYPR